MLLKITQAAAIGGIAVIVENGVALAIGEGGELCVLPICEACLNSLFHVDWEKTG